MQKFELLTPKNMDELLDALKESTENTKILAGGTDLLVSLNEGRISPNLIIDISRVQEMKYIKEDDENLYIGTLTTFTELIEDKLVSKYAHNLVEVAAELGSKQIQNRATIGGNIGNASPAGDSLPAIMALEGKVIIIDSDGKKQELPIEDVLIGPNKTSLNCNQAIIGIKIPKKNEDWLSTFVKLGSRTSVTISKLNIAMNIKYDSVAKVILEAKLALGSVGKTAFRAIRIEELFKNEKINREFVDMISQEISAEIENAIPGRASLAYKREAIKSVIYQAFENLLKEEMV